MSKKTYAIVLWLLFNKSYKKQIGRLFDTGFAKSVMKHAKPVFFETVCRIPSIGEHNPKLSDIVFSAFIASVYKSGNRKILPKQMDTIMTDGMESIYIFRKFAGMEDHFCKKWQDKRNAQAIFSKKRKYPADFVSEFIYGKTFNEYGIKYYECALYKLLKREGCAELAPLMCKFDYVMAKYMNANLNRTRTLVNGDGLCDFWYTKDNTK